MRIAASPRHRRAASLLSWREYGTPQAMWPVSCAVQQAYPLSTPAGLDFLIVRRHNGQVRSSIYWLRHPQDPRGIAPGGRRAAAPGVAQSAAAVPETLEYARYVIVFTTFPESEFHAAAVLRWYRLRWQVELVFKRFKSLAGLGHLLKRDSDSAWSPAPAPSPRLSRSRPATRSSPRSKATSRLLHHGGRAFPSG